MLSGTPRCGQAAFWKPASPASPPLRLIRGQAVIGARLEYGDLGLDEGLGCRAGEAGILLAVQVTGGRPQPGPDEGGRLLRVRP